MKTNIIVDSCCDIPAETIEKNDIKIAPFTFIIGDRAYLDNGEDSICRVKESIKPNSKITSKSPSPSVYMDSMRKDSVNFVLTVSEKMSDSYSSAMEARELAQKNGYDVHVFDTKSVSAGQMLIVLKLINLISMDLKKSEIIMLMNKYIEDTKTYGVCHDLSKLIEHNKINQMRKKILSALRIRPILGIADNGEIEIFSNARGDRQTIARFKKLVDSSKRKNDSEPFIITHANNIELAEKLKNKIKHEFNFGNIYIQRAGAVTSFFLNNKGTIIAF